MNRQAVEHFTEGKEAWRLGVLGFFTRIRGQIGAAAIALLAMGAPWWWPRNYTETISISTKTLIVAIPFVVGAIVVAGLYYLKNRSLRSLDIKYYLHGLAHYMRDQYTDCCRQSASPYVAPDADRSRQFRERLRQMCERTQTYFRLLINDQTIEVAMRLAVPQRVSATNTSVVYRTVARSTGLNQSRCKTTEDIPANEGIPRFLKHEKNSLGVLFYNDLGAAAELGAYRLTENDRLYAAEIKTMMVAPLNGWDGEKQSMIGLFYVTSRETDIFKSKYVDSMAFISDFVANAVASLVNKLHESHRLPSLDKELVDDEI